jgi:hypothetical protein
MTRSIHRISHPVTSSFRLPEQKNDRVRIWDGGGIGRKDQDDYSCHPELPIDCSFQEWQKRMDKYSKNEEDYFEQTFVLRFQFSDISSRDRESTDLMDTL